MSDILGLGDVRKLGKPGAYAVGYYMCTTVLAVITGLIMVNIMKPGVNRELEAAIGKVEATTGAEKTKAEAERDAIKDEIEAEVLKKTKKNKKAADAVEADNKRKQAKVLLKKAKEDQDVAVEALSKAESNLNRLRTNH